jgi:glutamyl-tRNA synthetase
VHDSVVGDVTVERSEVDDFVIFKTDGYPTYHFAVVVDDGMMDVTHVIRGQEHLNNTFKHILLQEAFEFKTPIYAHISLIFNPDGSKMSKRDKDRTLRKYVKDNGIDSSPENCIPEDDWNKWISSKENQLSTSNATTLAATLGITLPEINVEDFKRAGYMPEVLMNYLCLLGWSPGNDVEQFDANFLVENFSLDRVVKSPAKFDRAKLLAFNLDAFQKLSTDEFEKRLFVWCKEYAPDFTEIENFSLFAKANHERSKTFRDSIVTSMFLIKDDDAITWEESKPVKKALIKGEEPGVSRLPAVIESMKKIDSWDSKSIEDCLHDLAETLSGGNLGKVAQPIRVAVAGGPVSPPIVDTLILLGKDSTINRLERCVNHFLDSCNK